jgi:hypothetical protein
VPGFPRHTQNLGASRRKAGASADLDDFVNCWFGCSGAVSASKSKGSAVTDRRYSGNRHERKESERFKSFPYEELLKRDA